MGLVDVMAGKAIAVVLGAGAGVVVGAAIDREGKFFGTIVDSAVEGVRKLVKGYLDDGKKSAGGAELPLELGAQGAVIVDDAPMNVTILEADQVAQAKRPSASRMLIVTAGVATAVVLAVNPRARKVAKQAAKEAAEKVHEGMVYASALSHQFVDPVLEKATPYYSHCVEKASGVTLTVMGTAEAQYSAHMKPLLCKAWAPLAPLYASVSKSMKVLTRNTNKEEMEELQKRVKELEV